MADYSYLLGGIQGIQYVLQILAYTVSYVLVIIVRRFSRMGRSIEEFVQCSERSTVRRSSTVCLFKSNES